MTEQLKFYEYPKVLREAWAAQQALMHLGFPSDAVWFTHGGRMLGAEELGPLAAIELHAQGKEFKMICGRTGEFDPADLEAQWSKLVALYNARAYDPEEAQKVYRESFIFQNPQGTPGFISALLAKGFILPKQEL